MEYIPIVDLFAGPGGLSEGFASFQKGKLPVFKVKLSIEKDKHAYKTLQLRSFYRQFHKSQIPADYYKYLQGSLSRQDLFSRYSLQSIAAEKETWHAELGNKKYPDCEVDRRIAEAIRENGNLWVLIGGPPCQAYSIVGRSRIIGGNGWEEYEKDNRHFLYKQYLRILGKHKPPVFVMENVKGLLSATVKGKPVFKKILKDLENPFSALPRNERGRNISYNLYSLVKSPSELKGCLKPEDYVVRAEKYGIPQSRHRIIILGIRSDIHCDPKKLIPGEEVSIEAVLDNLPRLRSGISKGKDSGEKWKQILTSIPNTEWFQDKKIDDKLRKEILHLLPGISGNLDRGSNSMKVDMLKNSVQYNNAWFYDRKSQNICNHSTRSHIPEDLHRYFFVSAFAIVHKKSPLLNDFPPALLPNHRNVDEALLKTKFNDRFRVQCKGKPATTITSHISKDGHYFIHYDPAQCRSLTVREAARLQTFPDNYIFEGPRTEQYKQVGNAVPPLLARQIAEIVFNVLRENNA